MNWERRAHRGLVIAREGLLCTSQPLATSAGLSVLRDGGSCVDAAIAASAVLTVVEPYNSHLGGDAFGIMYDASKRRTIAVNGSGAAPTAASVDRFADGIPLRGLSAASTPGLVDCWFGIHARFGRLPFPRLLEPAIHYAEFGFPLSCRAAAVLASHDTAQNASWFPELRRRLFGPTISPRPGYVVRQPDLAWSLKTIADGGRDAFYDGPIADRIVAASQAEGGLFVHDDLRRHSTEVCEPLRTSYRNFEVHCQPPVSQGLILPEELNIVEGFDLRAMGFGSADAIHVMVEAKKLAFADRARWMGDPKHVAPAAHVLTSKRHADVRRAAISMHAAVDHVATETLGRDTTYLCAADRWGNAISFIQSVYHAFGCGVVVAGTGIVLNNRMTGFSLDPASPNCLAPGKRPMHTLNAYIITRDGALRWVGGTPGGDVQVQSNLQVICNLIDYGMDAQQAVEAPRWQHVPDAAFGGMRLQIEDRLPRTTMEDLRERGHSVAAIGPWQHGSAYQLIAVDEAGVCMGASDPRCDGHAAGI